MAIQVLSVLCVLLSLVICVQCFQPSIVKRPFLVQQLRSEHVLRLPRLEATRLSASTPLDDNSSIKPESQKVAESSDGPNFKLIVPALAGLAVVAYIASGHLGGIDLNGFLEKSVAKISELGPYGYLLFALIYITAEVLAIPAMPLTASSGYLFGLLPGTAIVLVSATIAASISFFIGRTFLRGWAMKIASGSTKWRAIDRAVGKEGFKVMLLLRLSPLLPFAISNYLYGLTSVDFGSYIAATFLGFAPGTFGVVYAGSAGKDLFSGDGAGLPWYAYAVGAAALIAFGKTVANVATTAIKHMEEEEAAEEAAAAGAVDTLAVLPGATGNDDTKLF